MEAKAGEEIDDDAMWDSDDVVGWNDCVDIEEPEGMAEKIWDDEEAMGDFEDSRLTLRLSITLFYRTKLGSPYSVNGG